MFYDIFRTNCLKSVKKRRKKGEKKEKERKKGKGEKEKRGERKKGRVFVDLHVPEYKQARGARRAVGAARSEKSM